ncbi:Mth938-like domain-containing protein [Denitromonas iodatirespirans]|uniref:Mth938-like domain-containing protein n=1 Tax=Denitromonas iodatirespirans TaxID=2795389 RepID=A0A944DMP9_DENI1|nr:Mth938-like domain-containing protein [Denitromonas iodatirespirans]MBT0961474.1 Mth938-like domain-containing protein [Denitromonas iodatirespirans]
MKLQPDTITDKNVITGYGPEFVQVNGADYRGNLAVLPDRIEAGWTAGGFDALSAADFATLAALGCEVLLIGTGERQRFPSPALLRPLIEARIGFEIMDVPAACRTYNILVGENRNVAAALLFDPG